MQTLNIGRKLVLGFGAILVVMAMLVMAALMNMSALHEDLVRIVLVNNKRVTIATGMATIVREEAIAVRNCFLQRERTEEMIKRINDYNAKFDEAFTQVEQMTSSDDAKERELLVLVKESWTASRALNERTLALLTAGRQHEAFALYEKESRAAVRQAIQATEDLVKHQQTRSEMRYDAATRHYRDTQLFMISIGIATFLLVIIIAIRF
ncbi:MAG TPA: MCP four helix bundle domain-containing protein [Thermodesulfovibrionales bacterium]|nr:MCP four helix bundle domain-containing protein [Thermodesulfovibrionales bacterium]